MKLKNLKLSIFLFGLLVLFVGCNNDGDAEPTDSDLIKAYSGSGSEGDLITFQINHSDLSYTVFNETTNQSEAGNYTVMDEAGLTGIYKVSTSAADFYAVELSDKIIAANFPTGNPANNISFGVSASLDNTDNVNNISGDYTYVIMDNDGIMGDDRIKEWGILSVNRDLSWDKLSFATNTGDGSIPEMSPEMYQGQIPVVNTGETGTWNADGENKERLIVNVNGVQGSLTGYVYATPNEAAFLLDLGTGNGFLIGLKITPNNNFGSIAGDYKFINVWEDGFGAGNYAIGATGLVNWVHQGSDGESSGSFQLIQSTNVFSNVFYANNVEFGTDYFEKVYCFIVGDIIVHFSFDKSNGDFSQYGIGAIIN